MMTCAWRVLLKSLDGIEGIEGVAHFIDPKSISKNPDWVENLNSVPNGERLAIPPNVRAGTSNHFNVTVIK